MFLAFAHIHVKINIVENVISDRLKENDFVEHFFDVARVYYFTPSGRIFGKECEVPGIYGRISIPVLYFEDHLALKLRLHENDISCLGIVDRHLLCKQYLCKMSCHLGFDHLDEQNVLIDLRKI